MSDAAIAVENLSKRYLVGHRSAQRERYTALRDVISREARNFARKTVDVVRGRQIIQGDVIDEFWALKDVSFDVKQGEVFGIIGRNGAGKSTLLKVLSRITEPTTGRIVLKGRVASLLEVGTGFHPELTGRENIFLNGAILGMTQREIRKKFDEIVAFAESENFLDTPVKHYSSGMYVRLAFAVAAHLEPEILIVDEVLAVGDAEFQKKCLGKMDEVSRAQGRTVLFVSHNMETVLKLCSRGILIESGRVRASGPVKTIVPTYLCSRASSPRVVDLSSRARPDYFTGKARVVTVSPSDATSNWSIPFGEPLSFDISIDAPCAMSPVVISIGLHSDRGFEIVSWSNKCIGSEIAVRPGKNTFRIGLNHLRLLPAQYSFSISVYDSKGNIDHVNDAVVFEIIPSLEAANIDSQKFDGVVVPSATISTLE